MHLQQDLEMSHKLNVKTLKDKMTQTKLIKKFLDDCDEQHRMLEQSRFEVVTSRSKAVQVYIDNLNQEEMNIHNL